ncbi:MAG: LLM class flavin-dependent oxidoreductase [Actinobacteria bacterium]|uniref:Unannotated protein n=1 Tax=freshwater metagenome TaxID=449393 RepID=A0A6J7S403_9ZZZZ|nr:LLM class flavin-dependent oxidoreductase [Actinomycetota bacterium]
MRIGLAMDLNTNGYNPPMPSPQAAADAMDAMIEECIIAERAGFHGIQVPDRHGRTETILPGPEQLLTILARETERVAIGSFTFVATLFHPMKSAEQFAVIDNLSRGRLFTTLSRGYHTGYWKQFGIPQERLLGRFKESLRIWELAFTGERFSFDGEFWQVEDGILAPGPFQEGGWPIWGGGQATDVAIQRCAEYGTSWTCDPFPLRKDVWDRQVQTYRDRAEELGKKPFVVLMRDGWVGDSFEDATRTVGSYFQEEMRFYFRNGIFSHHPEFQSEADITPERHGRHMIMGSPSQCIEQLEMYAEDYGVDYFTIQFRVAGGPPMEMVREQIQRFGEEVVQPIHKKYPAIDHPAIPVACRW